MKRLAVLICSFSGLLAVSVGCTNYDKCDPNDITCAINWTYSDTMTDAEHAYVCSDPPHTCSLGNGCDNLTRIAVSGSTITFTIVRGGSCRTAGGDDVGSYYEGVDIVDGSISGRTISFHTPMCQFEGALNGTPGDLSGTLTCQQQIGTEIVEMTGTWYADGLYVGGGAL